MILVDTSVLSHAFGRRAPKTPEPAEVLLLRRLVDEDYPPAVPGIVLQEILSGVRSSRQSGRLKSLLDGFPLVLATRDNHLTAATIANKCMQYRGLPDCRYGRRPGSSAAYERPRLCAHGPALRVEDPGTYLTKSVTPLIGSPGTGKSHIAKTVAHAAIQARYKVVYREAHAFFEDLFESDAEKGDRSYYMDNRWVDGAMIDARTGIPANRAAEPTVNEASSDERT